MEYLWKSASLHTTNCGLPVVAGLTCELCLHALQERPFGSIEVRRPSKVSTRSLRQQLIHRPYGHLLRVQVSIPGEYVKPLDLVDQHEDRATRRRNLVPLVAFKALTPAPQDTEFLRVQSASVHRPTLAHSSISAGLQSGAVSV